MFLFCCLWQKEWVFLYKMPSRKCLLKPWANVKKLQRTAYSIKILPSFPKFNKATLLDNTSETARGVRSLVRALEFIHSPLLLTVGVTRVSVVPESLYESFLFQIISAPQLWYWYWWFFFLLKKVKTLNFAKADFVWMRCPGDITVCRWRRCNSTELLCSGPELRLCGSPVGEARPHPEENQLKWPQDQFFTQLGRDILTTVGIKYCGFFLIPSRKTQLYSICWENTNKYAYWANSWQTPGSHLNSRVSV